MNIPIMPTMPSTPKGGWILPPPIYEYEYEYECE
jgi:hypothetical protein